MSIGMLCLILHPILRKGVKLTSQLLDKINHVIPSFSERSRLSLFFYLEGAGLEEKKRKLTLYNFHNQSFPMDLHQLFRQVPTEASYFLAKYILRANISLFSWHIVVSFNLIIVLTLIPCQFLG